MSELKYKLVEILSNLEFTDGLYKSPVPGVHCVKFTETSDYSKRKWHSCLAIAAQGSKDIILGNNIYSGEEWDYTATPVVLPVISRIAEATKNKPFLAILIELDPLILSEVASQIENYFQNETTSLRAIFVGKADEKMLDASIRLAKLFYTPQDAPILGPLLIKEMFYHLLKGPNGSSIRQFVHSGSNIHRIFQVIYQLKSELNKEIDVTTLAKSADMSRSSFFKYFNDVTSLSPVQYQKRLRLLEAKRLMLEEGETAENSAFKVGYKSTSQFSREYSRMFGNSPIRDVMKIKSPIK